MDIANNPSPEQPVEPSHEPDGGVSPVEAELAANVEPSIDEQETLSLPQNTEFASDEAETLMLPGQSEPVEEAETLMALDNAEPVSDGAKTPNLPDDTGLSGNETVILSSPDPAKPLVENAVVLNETENAAPLASVPDALATNGAVRRKSRYSPWLQIAVVVLLACLVGGVVLAVRLPGGANTPAQKAHGTPTPVPPLKITAWCSTNSATVDPQLGKVSLYNVVALSANDAWMLGETSNEKTRQTLPLVEHWNGTTWSVVPTADTTALLKQLLDQTNGGKASEMVSLNDMAVLSDRDIWAVGSIFVAKVSSQSTSYRGFPIVHENQSSRPLIEHWDGSTWQIVASPSGFTGNPTMPSPSTNTLMHISAVSANDIWAVGSQASKNEQTVTVDGQTFKVTLGGSPAPLVEHWDGISWTERKLPASLLKATFFTLDNIKAFSSNDVWSYGTSIDMGFVAVNRGTQPTVGSTKFGGPSGGSFTSHLLHWDGQNWNQVNLPDKNTIVRDVQIISDNNIWLITENGMLEGKPGSQLNAIYHWDGTTWSKVPEVNSADPESVLNSFSVIALDNLWLLGHTGKNQPLMEHWDGKTWSQVSPTTPTYGSAQSMTVAGNRAWATVSAYDTKSAQKTASDTFVNPTGSVLETNC